jgi:hypothetical protein
MVSEVNTATAPAGVYQESRNVYLDTELGGGCLTWSKTRLFQKRALEAPSSIFEAPQASLGGNRSPCLETIQQKLNLTQASDSQNERIV